MKKGFGIESSFNIEIGVREKDINEINKSLKKNKGKNGVIAKEKNICNRREQIAERLKQLDELL